MWERILVGLLTLAMWTYNAAILPIQLLEILIKGTTTLDPWGMV